MKKLKNGEKKLIEQSTTNDLPSHRRIHHHGSISITLEPCVILALFLFLRIVLDIIITIK